jgi:DNA-binding Xre family transcriptional regulator
MYNGKLVNVSLETLDTLCKALNCTYDDLIEEE